MGLIKNKTAPIVNPERETPRDRDELIRRLESPDATERRWAARDLAQYADSIAPLLMQLGREPDVSVREVILTTLTRLADRAAVNGLAARLRSDDAGARSEAIEAMKAMPAAVAPIMRDLLADRDPDVRILAINILESLRHPDVEAWLIGVIEDEPMINVCATAVDLLSEVGSGTCREALRGVQARFAAEPYIQFAVNLALKRIERG